MSDHAPPDHRLTSHSSRELLAVEEAATLEPFAVLPEIPEDAWPDPEPASGSVARRPAFALAILCAATFLGALDLLIVNVALEPIGRGVGETSLGNLSWILNGYAIVFAALLVPAGRLADRYGRKGGFLTGLAVFAVASLGAAVADNLWVLVGFRVLQAAGAAMLTPASLALVLSLAPPAKVTKYVQIWAASGSLAAAAGPALGGLLVEQSWRWIFFINLPISLAAIVLAASLIPRVPRHAESRMPDPVGGLLLILSIGALALGLVKAPEWTWGSPATVATLALSGIALVLFVARSATAAEPIVDLRLFRDHAFSSGSAAALLFYASFVVQLLGIILWLQGQWGWSAVSTGFAIAPGPCMVFGASVLARRLATGIPVGLIAATGAVLAAIGIAIVALSTDQQHIDYAGQILPGWLLGGVGIGLALPTIFSSATAHLPSHQAATGSAVVNMAGQIGSVVGASLLVILLARQGAGDAHHAFAIAWWTASGLALASAVIALGLGFRREPTAAA